jgi:hypothetical protein
MRSLLLSDFPSGSSINYHSGKFYLTGDDSTHILIMDQDYQKIDSVHLFDHSEKRIPKADKIDLEGSAILEIEGANHLLILGSASRKNRKRIILIPFSDMDLDFKTHKHSIHKTKDFIKRVKSTGIEEINLEGICLLNGDLILGNRGNRSNQSNHLIITDQNFWERQETAKLLVRKLVTPAHDAENLGLSELCYIKELDILLITFTSEATANAYDDGAIGNSYVGILREAAVNLQAKEVRLEHLINLADVEPLFKNEKIEGVCAERITGKEIILHLVSDNDAGESRLFKIKMLLE